MTEEEIRAEFPPDETAADQVSLCNNRSLLYNSIVYFFVADE